MLFSKSGKFPDNKILTAFIVKYPAYIEAFDVKKTLIYSKLKGLRYFCL
jgi:hypothetical protein